MTSDKCIALHNGSHYYYTEQFYRPSPVYHPAAPFSQTLNPWWVEKLLFSPGHLSFPECHCFSVDPDVLQRPTYWGLFPACDTVGCWQNFPEVGPSVKKLGHYGNALGGDTETPVLPLLCLCLHGSLMRSLSPHHNPLTGSVGLLRAESNRTTQS